MRHRRIAAALALGVSAALLLAGCSSPSKSSNDSKRTSVNVGLVLEPTDLDIRHTSGIALDQVLIDNVYQGLLSRQQDGSVKDSLASSHTVSDDGLKYTFTVRKGVTFDDGAALTVDDVVWSLEQVKDDAKNTVQSSLSHVTSIAAAGDDVVLTLSSPDSNLLWSLSGRAGLVLEKAATNDLKTTANGTGPYLLKSWKQGDSITFTRNKKYWGSQAKVDTVVFRYIPDGTAAINATLAGELDVQTAVDPTLASQLDGNADYTVEKGKTTDKYTLAFNNQRAPLNDVRVRQALRQAIDPHAIIKAVGGAGVAQGGPIPQLDPGYEDLTSVDAYNPAHAKKLLAQAGQKNLMLTLIMPNIYSTAVADVLVSELKAVGVTLAVQSVEFATWLTEVYTNHDYELSFVDHAESRDFANWANPNYYFGYNNAQVQQLYAASVAATSADDASEKLRQAASIVSHDAAADWLYTAVTLTAVRHGVTGFPTDSTSARLNLANLSVSK